MQRTLVVGDIHGCLREFDELLRCLGYQAGKDRLVLVGDLVDRGPDPVGVVRRARELGAQAVMGNHEERLLRWARHEAQRRENPSYKNPMRPLPDATRRQHEALSGDDLAYLRAMPSWLRVDGDWLVVHAGFLPDRALAKQKEAVMLRIRYVDAEGRMVPLQDPRVAPPGAVHWSARWTGPENVVYGHDVGDFAVPRVAGASPGHVCYGIDTGCCYGGRLTALVLPSREIVQVPAREAHATLDAEDA